MSRFSLRTSNNVQGDERDVMFISIGYGRTAEGYLAKMSLLGPLNRSWRRKSISNVLITRARQTLARSLQRLSADDIDLTLERNTTVGTVALKTVLT